MEGDVSEWQSQTTLEMTLRDVHPISSLPTVNQIDRTEKKKRKTNKQTPISAEPYLWEQEAQVLPRLTYDLPGQVTAFNLTFSSLW